MKNLFMSQDSLQVINSNYQNTMDILKILVWPAVAIIVALIFRRPLSNFLNKATRLGFGGASVESDPPKQESKEKSLLEQSNIRNDIIESALGIFSQQTLERAKSLVEKESKIADVVDPNKKIE